MAERDPASLTAFADQNPRLRDWALFDAICQEQGVDRWQDFPAPLRDRDSTALAKAKDRLHDAIQISLAKQWLFFRQWASIRCAAQDRIQARLIFH